MFGGVGVGLVWGWLIGRYRATQRNLLTVGVATAVVATEHVLLLGWIPATMFAAFTIVGLGIHVAGSAWLQRQHWHQT